jgi:hypothetical protein
MIVIWRWSNGSVDPVVVSKTRGEVERTCVARGYCVRPEYGKALELTAKQWEQLKDDIKSGRVS